MRIVPQFGSKKDILARNARLLDGVADSRLGPVYTSSVDVAVASLQRNGDSPSSVD